MSNYETLLKVNMVDIFEEGERRQRLTTEKQEADAALCVAQSDLDRLIRVGELLRVELPKARAESRRDRGAVAKRKAQDELDKLLPIAELFRTELPKVRAILCRAQQDVAIQDARLWYSQEFAEKRIEYVLGLIATLQHHRAMTDDDFEQLIQSIDDDDGGEA